MVIGETQQSFSFGYRIGKATINRILSETSEAIFQTLKYQIFKTSNYQKEWLSVSKDFEDKWNFPHCLDSLDGKHIRKECIKMAWTCYYNYKGFCSIVLLAIYDSNYCNDCVHVISAIRELMENDKLGIPAHLNCYLVALIRCHIFCWRRDFPVENLANKASTSQAWWRSTNF